MKPWLKLVQIIEKNNDAVDLFSETVFWAWEVYD